MIAHFYRRYNSNGLKTSLILAKALVLLTLFAQIGEVYHLLTNRLESQTRIYTPLFLKLSKDFGILVLTLVVTVQIFKRKSIYTLQAILCVLLILVSISIFISGVNQSLVYTFAGLRWLAPLVLAILMIGEFNRDDLTELSSSITFVFLCSFIVQIAQVFLSGQWYGSNDFGLSRRNPGLFLIPNSSAFYSCCTLFFHLFFNSKCLLRKVVLILLPISIALTSSGTGIAVYSFLIFLYFLGKRRSDFVSMFFLLGFTVTTLSLAIFLLPFITGRPHIVSTSGWDRISRLFLYFDLSFFSTKFGTCCNSSILAEKILGKPGKGRIVDSMITSILANFGWIGLLLFVLMFLCWLARILGLKKNLEVLSFTFLFFLFSLTTIVTEAYPMNVIFAILFGYYSRGYFMLKYRRNLGEAPI